MAFKKATIAADGTTITIDSTTNSYVDVFVGMFTGPFKAFSSAAESNLITEREAGIRALGSTLVGAAFAESWGHKRERAGKGPLIGFLSSN